MSNPSRNFINIHLQPFDLAPIQTDRPNNITSSLKVQCEQRLCLFGFSSTNRKWVTYRPTSSELSPTGIFSQRRKNSTRKDLTELWKARINNRKQHSVYAVIYDDLLNLDDVNVRKTSTLLRRADLPQSSKVTCSAYLVLPGRRSYTRRSCSTWYGS